MTSRRTACSHSNTASQNENNNNNDRTENNTESLQGEISVEPNTNPTDNAQQNPLQIPEIFYSEIFTGEKPQPSVQLQQQFPECFSSVKTQAEIERLDYNITEELKLEINNYENKNCNVINWHNKWNIFILEFSKKIFLRKKNTDVFNIKTSTTTASCEIWFFHSFFMSLQKDKNEHLIRMQLTLLSCFYCHMLCMIQQNLPHLKTTVLIFF